MTFEEDQMRQKHTNKHTHKQGNKQPNKQKPNLYGFHAVHAAWLNPDRDIQTLYMTQNAAKGFEDTLRASKHLGRPNPTVLENKVFDKLLPRECVHQGIALLVKPLPEISVQDFIIKAQQNSLIVILDQVTDPHNVGAILRSACAFGAAAVVMQKKHAPEMGGVLAKAASGGLEHIPVIYETNLSRAMEELKKGGFFVYGLDERGEDIGGMKPGGKVALVLGAEGPGMRHNIGQHCDALARLPIGDHVESLNVSNAAAIALYAIAAR